jgi:hypothetical protein
MLPPLQIPPHLYMPPRNKGLGVNSSLGIVLPVCNAEARLRRQVHNLLEVLPDVASRFEVMIVDDGSSDSTNDVAHELATEYPQVRVLRHAERQGTQAALQTAMPHLASDVVYVHNLDEPLRSSDLTRAVGQAPGTAEGSPRLMERLMAWGEALESAQRAFSAVPAPLGVGHAATDARPALRRPTRRRSS